MSRLEEIKQDVKSIMRAPYAVRKEKAEEVGIDLVMTGKVDELLQEIDELNEQNKRYKKLISGFLDSGYASDWVKEQFIQALEGSCIHCNGKGFNGLDYCTQCNQREESSDD